MPLIFDAGCGHSISRCMDDFVTELEPVPNHVGVTNFENDVTKPQGQGWVEWNMRDALGRTSTIRTLAYYIPNAQVRLFCPCQCKQEQKATSSDARTGNCSCEDDQFTFVDPHGQELTFILTPSRCPPAMDLEGVDPALHVDVTPRMIYNLNVIRSDPETLHAFNDLNTNLSKPQKELKLWHCRLAHCGFLWVQTLMQVQKDEVGSESTPPLIPTKHTSTVRCDLPKCSA